MFTRFLCLMLLLCVVFAAPQILFAQGSASPVITSFTSDLLSITPDQAESGAQYANLTWTTNGLRATDRICLQVFVLDQWHDAQPDLRPANGSVRWAVAHTLDFTPPRFRLVIRDNAGQELSAQELTIPYTTTIDPANPPTIVSFSTMATVVKAQTAIQVSWDVRNRPARSNLRFVQFFDQGRILNIELPRTHRWIRSVGTGNLIPIAGANAIRMRLELYDIDTGSIYDQRELTLPGVPVQNYPPPTVRPTPAASAGRITDLRVNHTGLRRGQTLGVQWATRGAKSIWMDIHDIDFFPYSQPMYVLPPPYRQFKDLPPSGSLDIPIPADYGGAGWGIFLFAGDGQAGTIGDEKALNVLFVDVPQPIQLNVKQFEIDPPTVKRGDPVTIRWATSATTRQVDSSGQIVQVPISTYDHGLWITAVAANASGTSVGTALNARFDRQPLTGSVQWHVADFDPAFSQLWLTLGLTVNDVETVYGTRIYPILLDSPRTETVTAAYQSFEHGFMIWNGKTGDVHVYEGLSGGNVQVFLQSEYGPLLDNPVKDVPPQGFVKPINGFGRVWGNYQHIRTGLGWALGAEIPCTLVLQYDTGQPAPDVTFILPDGRTIHQHGSAWSQ